MDRSDQSPILQLNSVSHLSRPHFRLARLARKEEWNESIETDHLHPHVYSCLPFYGPRMSWRLVLSLSDEIVKLREYRTANPNASAPAFDDPGYRALIEENVKTTVSHIADDAVMTDVSSLCLPPHFHSTVSERFLGLSSMIDDPAR